VFYRRIGRPLSTGNYHRPPTCRRCDPVRLTMCRCGIHSQGGPRGEANSSSNVHTLGLNASPAARANRRPAGAAPALTWGKVPAPQGPRAVARAAQNSRGASPHRLAGVHRCRTGAAHDRIGPTHIAVRRAIMPERRYRDVLHRRFRDCDVLASRRLRRWRPVGFAYRICQRYTE
jgi:hypothetical protein